MNLDLWIKSINQLDLEIVANANRICHQLLLDDPTLIDTHTMDEVVDVVRNRILYHPNVPADYSRKRLTKIVLEVVKLFFDSFFTSEDDSPSEYTSYVAATVRDAGSNVVWNGVYGVTADRDVEDVAVLRSVEANIPISIMREAREQIGRGVTRGSIVDQETGFSVVWRSQDK